MRLFRKNFAIHVAVVLGLLSAAAPASASWRYYDEKGAAHVVDTRSQVPEKYRGQAVDLEKRDLSQAERDLETARLKEQAKAGPVAVQPDSGFRPAFSFRLPRLPTWSELFALDIASHAPHFSWGLLTAHQGVGAGPWNFGTILLGLIVGGVAFFLIEKYKSADAPVRFAVPVVAVIVIIANILISGYATKLDSAVSLFNTARGMNGGRVALSTLPAGLNGTAVKVTGVSGGGGGATSDDGSRVAPIPANTDNPYQRKPSGDPKADFEEMKRSMQEMVNQSSQTQNAVLDQVAK